MPDRESLVFHFASWIAGGGYELPMRKVITSRRHRWLRRLGMAGFGYLMLPMAIFEFTESGPRPRLGMPFAHPEWDISGDFGYSESAWPFVVWKPVLTVYGRARGFEVRGSWQ
jgi:hypothetical protein